MDLLELLEQELEERVRFLEEDTALVQNICILDSLSAARNSSCISRDPNGVRTMKPYRRPISPIGCELP